MPRRSIPFILALILAAAFTGATLAGSGGGSADDPSTSRASQRSDTFFGFLLQRTGLALRLATQRGLSMLAPDPMPSFGTNGLSDGPDPVGDSADNPYGPGDGGGPGDGQPGQDGNDLPVAGGGGPVGLTDVEYRDRGVRRYGDD